MSIMLQISIKELQKHLTDDQILEVLVMAESRKMDACRLLIAYMHPRWKDITMIDAMKIMQVIQKEIK